MMNRKYLACMAAVVLLAGCGNAKEDKTTEDTTKEETTEETTDTEEDAAEETQLDTADEAQGDTADEGETDTAEDTEETEDADAAGDADDAGDTEDADEELEDDTEEVSTEEDLAEVVPADYLVEDADKYVTLGDCDGLEAEQYNYEITDAMVQEEIDSQLQSAAEEISTDEASVEGNTVYLTLTYKIQGSSDEEESEDTSILLGEEDYGAEFDEKLTGVSTGDTLDFSITFDDDIWIEEWANQTIDFTAEITDVVETQVPEYDLDFVKENSDYTTLEEYEESIRESLEEDYASQSYYDVTEQLIELGMEASTFDGYPQELYDQCEEEVLSMYSMFVGDDTTIEDVLEMFGMTDEDVAEETETQVKRHLFVSAYCNANGINPDGEAYKDYVTEYADYYGEDASVFEEYYTREYLVYNMYEDQVKEMLYQSANITETTATDTEDEEATDEVLEEDVEEDTDEALDAEEE